MRPDFTRSWLRSEMRSIYFLLAICGLLALVAGCGSANSVSTLIYAQPEDPKTLDPINTDIAEAVHVLTNVFDTLVTYHDETMEIVPALAESWEHSDDGLTWTFHLRQGVTFHDSTPLTSEAVKVSLERLILPDHPLLFDKVPPHTSRSHLIHKV